MFTFYVNCLFTISVICIHFQLFVYNLNFRAKINFFLIFVLLDQLKKLQRRYESTEEELHKKRAELREALRNDTVPIVSTLSTRHPRVAGEPGSMAEPDYTHKKYSSTLPKMELKSPARVMEEKSCGESSRSSRSATPPVSASALMASSTASSVTGQVAESPAELPKMPVSHLRRRSGTPASGRSRVRNEFKKSKLCIDFLKKIQLQNLFFAKKTNCRKAK